MSAEKVRRWEPEIKYEGLGRMSESTMVEFNTGRYIEYADVAGLVGALKAMMRGYVNTLENARDRITELGGKCDELGNMEAYDVHLNKARNELARWQS